MDGHDFEHVRRSAAGSAIVNAGDRIMTTIETAWTTSAIGRRWRSATQTVARATPAARIRWWAITIAVAASAHMLLRSFMSATIAPAMPLAVYVVPAAGGALIAWQAESFHRAWSGSWVVGLGSWLKVRRQDRGLASQDPGPGTQDPDDRD